MKVNFVELPGDGYHAPEQWSSPGNSPDYSMRAAVYYRIWSTEQREQNRVRGLRHSVRRRCDSEPATKFHRIKV